MGGPRGGARGPLAGEQVGGWAARCAAGLCGRMARRRPGVRTRRQGWGVNAGQTFGGPPGDGAGRWLWAARARARMSTVCPRAACGAKEGAAPVVPRGTWAASTWRRTAGLRAARRHGSGAALGGLKGRAARGGRSASSRGAGPGHRVQCGWRARMRASPRGRGLGATGKGDAPGARRGGSPCRALRRRRQRRRWAPPLPLNARPFGGGVRGWVAPRSEERGRTRAAGVASWRALANGASLGAGAAGLRSPTGQAADRASVQ